MDDNVMLFGVIDLHLIHIIRNSDLFKKKSEILIWLLF